MTKKKEELRRLPAMTEKEYREVAGILNAAIVLAITHGMWNDAKNGPIMEKCFPEWEKLEPERKPNPVECPHCEHKIWLYWNAPDGIWLLSTTKKVKP